MTVTRDQQNNTLTVLYLQSHQSNFIMFVVCFLLGNSPASEFYMLTFRNILSVPSS